MKRTAFYILTAMFLATTAHAQSTSTVVSPVALNLPEGATLERSAEVDGDPATQEFVLADYTWFPTQRTILQLRPDRTVCVGEWSYWLGDNPHNWPTWITVNGLTKAMYRNERGDWVILHLDLPTCR
jgi:hypothetical protein